MVYHVPWGIEVAIFLWFAAMAGMGEVIIALIDKHDIKKSVLKHYSGFILIFSILALIFILSDLPLFIGALPRIISAFLEGRFNLASWMSIGMILLSLEILIASIDVIKYRRLSKWISLIASKESFRIISIVIGGLVTLYSGFLLSVSSIPIWTISPLPILWIFSGALAAIALLDILLWLSGEENPIYFTLRLKFSFGIIVGIIIFMALHISASSRSMSAKESAHMLLYGDLGALFWIGFSLLGLILPTIVDGIQIFSGKSVKEMSLVSSLLYILGALMLRILIIYAGVPYWKFMVI